MRNPIEQQAWWCYMKSGNPHGFFRQRQLLLQIATKHVRTEPTHDLAIDTQHQLDGFHEIQTVEGPA
jgi:hypothetical protein